MKTITKSYQTDEQTKKRFDTLKKRFQSVKDSKKRADYVEFERYYLYIHKENKTNGLRWFHQDKYKIEVVVNGDTGPHQNIAGFVLFSKYDDAILHMTLTEHHALQILEDRDKKNLIY